MLPTSEEVIARLEAARNRPPSLDKGAVEAAFRNHFRALGLEPFPVRWVSDAVQGYIRASECIVHLILNCRSQAKHTSASSSYSSAFRDACEILEGLILLTEPSKLDVLKRTESAAWHTEDALALRATCQEAATRTYDSPRGTARRVSHSNVFIAEPFQGIAAKTASLASYWPTVVHSIMKAQKYLPPGIELKDVEPYKISGYEIWKPFVDAFEAGLWLYWVLNEEILAVPRPIIHSSSNRLHCETGLAVRWLDGSGFYFWHGLRVPPRVILQPPETITLQQILEERDEGLQQVLIERFGIERLLRDKERVTVKSAPWLISPWVDLELFGLPDDDEVIVEVTSPESGGKHVLQMCCRPETHRDDRGFLHCETGPAISWPGGSRLYFWHGEQVPEQAILCPHTLTPQQILQEPNAEVRRVMIERFGADRLIREAKTEMVDQSSWGTLYELEFDDDESLMMVEVTCPSTGRKYLLRVPPDITTAQRAVAWTFDLRPEDYQPAQQT